VGQMSRRRRPRTFSEDPWVMWPCCVLPTILLLAALLMVIVAGWASFFGGDFWTIYLVVLGGIAGLFYAVHKRYGPP
jgi:hypothetical protein